MSHRFTACAAGLVLLSVSAANAAEVTISPFSRGCVDEFGAPTCGTSFTAGGNFFTGFNPSGVKRSFFLFNLSSVTDEIVAATLNVSLDPTIGFAGPDASESVGFFELSDDSETKLAGATSDLDVFADLGSGTNLGGPTITPADEGTTIDFNVGASFLAALNGARGDSLFGLGGSLLTLSPNPSQEEGVFGFSSNATFSLTLTTEAAVIPLPGALPLLLAGLAGLGLAARRR